MRRGKREGERKRKTQGHRERARETGRERKPVEQVRHRGRERAKSMHREDKNGRTVFSF
jgi:hypothetical protein